MDIKEVTQDAKDYILEHGEHHPTMYVEFEEKELNLMVFADFPYETTFEKQKALFSVGAKLGQESPGKEIRQIIFVIEAWTSTWKKDGEPYPYERPSEDPNRKEVLMVQVMEPNKQTRELKQSVHIIEMLRDGSGELVDLLPRTEQLEVNYNKMLTAFLAGFESSKLPDKELAKMIENVLRKRH